MLVRLDEFARVTALHQAEADEQASEKQNFGGQEQPHTDFDGIELLLHRGEVMLMVRVIVPVRSIVLDGEAIALDQTGRPRPFQITASRLGSRTVAATASTPVTLFVFDVLHVDGRESSLH